VARINSMMKEVLRVVHDCGLLSKGDIVDKLGIQESTLEHIFSLLSSKGYLRKIGFADVSRDCMCCASCIGCMKNAAICTEYEITPKGKTYLETN
jgi:hypothetical protein